MEQQHKSSHHRRHHFITVYYYYYYSPPPYYYTIIDDDDHHVNILCVILPASNNVGHGDRTSASLGPRTRLDFSFFRSIRFGCYGRTLPSAQRRHEDQWTHHMCSLTQHNGWVVLGKIVMSLPCVEA